MKKVFIILAAALSALVVMALMSSSADASTMTQCYNAVRYLPSVGGTFGYQTGAMEYIKYSWWEKFWNWSLRDGWQFFAGYHCV